MLNVLGVAIDNLTKKQILQRVRDFLDEKKFHQIVTVNPEFILKAQKDQEFQDVLSNADLRVADGIGIRFALMLSGVWLKARMPGADLMREILALAEHKQLKVFLAASKEGLSTWKETRDAIKKMFPRIKLHGANMKKNGQKLPPDIFKSDIVLCNFGIPKQEKFAQSLKSGTIRLYMGVGGSFDYLTKKTPRAPRLLRIIGLEWLWRFFLQPWRWKRISRATIIFPTRVIIYKLLKTSAKGGFASGEKKLTMVRVRFAPSPTGYLHVGGFRTALYAFLFARKNNGVFILKIEDTDQKRFVEGAVENLIKTLDWAELFRNEGVFTSVEIKDDATTVIGSKNYPGVMEVGEYGPYIQSEKLETYKQCAQKLIESNHAYYCFCDSKRLESMRQEQIARKLPPIYDRHCLENLSTDEIQKNLESKKPYVIRLKIPKDEAIVFSDIIRGEVKFNTSLIDDQVLLKSDGYPTYHLASVVDDYEMRITHVIRGEEWLPSVPKHLLLYRYLEWEIPEFAHLPLLLNQDRTKLSKRQGDVAVEDYIKKGYLKEAIINFTALLGWHPGEGETQEIFTLEELVEKFDLAHVHKAGAVFDLKKLDWINSQYIKKLSVDDLYDRALGFLEKKEFYQQASPEKKQAEYVKKVLIIEQERLVKLSEVGEQNQFFFRDPEYDKELLRWKNASSEETQKYLLRAMETLEKIHEEKWKTEYLKNILLKSAGDQRGELLWPIRAALTGESKSPSPFEVAWVLGKEESLRRIKRALDKR